MAGISGEKMCAGITCIETGLMEEKRQWNGLCRNVRCSTRGWIGRIKNVRRAGKLVERHRLNEQERRMKNDGEN